MKRLASAFPVVVAACAAAIAGTNHAHAEPRFAAREGLACHHCHVNRTGGGMRTAFGVTWAQSHLPTWRVPGVADPRIGTSMHIGGDLRLAERTLLPARTELAGKRYGSKPASQFEMPEANAYLRADLAPERLLLYLDETVGPEGAASREAFVLLQAGGAYGKAGRFLLPYGLRIPDDAAFMRQQTGYTYANQDLGFELGWSQHPWSFALAVTNGSLGGPDTNLWKQVTAHVAHTWTHGRLAASLSWNDQSAADHSLQTWTAGLHGLARLGRLTALASGDWVHASGGGGEYDQWALFGEGAFEAVHGLHLRGRFEAFDPARQIAHNERDRFVLAASWFAVQLLELRVEYRLNRDIPQRLAGNADEVLLEIHGFF